MLESLLSLLNGEKPNEVVWTADINYWMEGHGAETVKNKGWDKEIGYLELCKELGCMPFYWYPKHCVGNLAVNDKIQYSVEEKSGVTCRIWETSVGSIYEESQYMEISKSQAITKHPVSDLNELKILLYILQNGHMQLSHVDDYTERMQLYAKYDGLPLLAMPRSPLSFFLVDWAGVEAGIYLMIDQSDLVNEALRLMEEHESPLVEALCELSPPLVHFSDNLTSEVYTSFFDTYMDQPYRKRLDAFHDAGIKCSVHLDGTMTGLLPKLAKVGLDITEALTPKPVGDLAVDEMRGVAGNDNLIFWGGVPGALFAPPYTWADMEKHVEETLSAWQGQPFVLGVGDQVPPNGDISMVRKITDMVEGLK